LWAVAAGERVRSNANQVEFDLVAELGELVDQTVAAALGVVAVGDVVGAEVAVGLAVGGLM
jgi:hypothetical protein